MRGWIALLLCLGCAPATAAPAGPLAPGARVLFIGNSLTYTHDVPGMVRALSKAAGVPLVVDAVTLPGASIGDHLDEGTAARRLRAERWDVVVLQQGPSSRAESRRE